ncbi:hypothetical protein EUB14_03200 [Mycobacterium tuberculosis]|nr:hypothetical protein [Mycobacterium tuberculosis]RXR76933.1 hypothetical protein EUB14_03200 [Mycobacterium tuberculosis]
MALSHVADEERSEALLRERSLHYVASSRAGDMLVVTWSGQRSELLSQLKIHAATTTWTPIFS